MASVLSAFVAISSLVNRGYGNAFLAYPTSLGERFGTVDRGSVEDLLLAEVRGFMGTGLVDLHLPVIQKALEPMWLSLPKNRHGNLDHLEVRYALRRLFVQRHGWHIDGLEHIGTEDVGESTARLLRGRVPAFLMSRFEEAFGSTGLQLHELAIFATALEHIIHDEATDRLNSLYATMGWSTLERLTTAKARKVLEAFTLSIIKGSTRADSAQRLWQLLHKMSKAYPGWIDTVMWVSDLFETAAHIGSSLRNPFVQPQWSFAEIESIAHQISQGFGHFQNTECQTLKNDILQGEDGRTGRVRLSDFYKKFLETSSIYKESAESLRKMGALEERGGEPRVIVSNYVLAPSNCLADTGFYSICCMNECEQVMAHIEQTVAAPFAPAERIVSIIANLSTSTVEATGALAEDIVERLKMVAQRHGGFVPLYGRLFAQWLHVVFPRECPFPHASGSLNTTKAADYVSMEGHRTETSVMEQYIENVSAVTIVDETPEEEEKESVFQWQQEELMYSPGEQPCMTRTWAGVWSRAISVCAAFVVVVAALATVAKRCMPDLQGNDGKTHHV
eukprot:TRINITY_DN11612_c0_g1_i1.p1 TRINITY_DN11612_c0_g1~~TRINITY_DN11612_c0_g1_i1.p1  ORF type:complete len:592 (+),score=70.55 TRINITY_DN11612_c0_g1_i1:93-1778(+)